MQTATILTNGATQTVQLPEGVHLDGTEVYVKRVGRSLLLSPKDVDPWDVMEESLAQFTDDYMEDRAQPAQQLREAPFE
jgi:antitoxin VapB